MVIDHENDESEQGVVQSREDRGPDDQHQTS
jgi:hypothetical protein